MRSRVAGLGVTGLSVMTFHAAALRQLQHFWPKAVGGPAPMVLSSKASALAETAGSLGLPRDRLLVRDVASEIEWAKVSRVRRADYASAAAQAGRTPPGSLSLEQVAAIYSRYRDLLTERGQMDFEDVLGLTVGLLGDRPDLADQVRQRYRWITVDEYQDVSAVQQTLLKLWLGDSDDVCVVGDPAQTIYTFAGASRTYIDGFGRWFPNATTVTLDRTYRCSPQVVGTANRSSPCPGRSPRAELAWCRRSRTGRRSRFGRTPRITPRPRRQPPRQLPGTAPGCRCGKSRFWCGSTPPQRRWRTRWPTRASPTRSRAGSDSSTGLRSARRSSGCAARPTARSTSPPDRLSARSWSRWGSTPEPRPRAEGRSGTAGNRSRPCARSPTTLPPATLPPPWGTWLPSWTVVRRWRRPRWPTPSRWRRCMRPRAWSGTRSGSRACRRAHCRSATPTPISGLRRSGACCTWA